MEKEIVSFLSLIEKLKSTLRHSYTRSGRTESSAEHTWRIAVFFLLFYETYRPAVDPFKTLKMILIHDLPEMVHGDIPAWMKDIDRKKHEDHKVREAEAARQLFARFPGPTGEDLYRLFEEYEAKKTPEARYAQAFDKIESQLQHLDAGPTTWSDEEKGPHMLHYPDRAVTAADDPHLKKIWDLIAADIAALT